MQMLKINGVEKEFPAGLPSSVAELLEHLEIKAATVAAEVDGRIVERSKFGEEKLRSGQAIELVRFVGGG